MEKADPVDCFTRGRKHSQTKKDRSCPAAIPHTAHWTRRESSSRDSVRI